jgi:hypothetical protein
MPQRGWAMRNYRYLSGSLLPALVRKRESTGSETAPEFLPLAPHEVEVVWIGHASFLVRTQNFNILIDPVWAKWVGPLKRHRDPGIDIEHLPKIDLVLITHAHFDHLCRMTLKRIVDGSQTVIVPRGVSQVLRKLNLDRVEEMSDWDCLRFRDAEIHFTPAHHWGLATFTTPTRVSAALSSNSRNTLSIIRGTPPILMDLRRSGTPRHSYRPSSDRCL